MKVVYVFPVLALLAASNGKVIRRTRDVGGQDPELFDDCHDADGNPISGKPYTFPGDCTKFYQCSGGYRTWQNCANGTVFNPALTVCDWPENVPGCGKDESTEASGTDTTTTEVPETEAPITEVPNTETEAPETGQPATQKPFDDDCVDEEGSIISGKPFQNPDDCGSFYQCSNGYRTSQNCAPEGTVFNPTLSVCDWPENVPGCGGDETTETPTTEVPETGASTTQKTFDDDCMDEEGNTISGKPFQNPEDCGSFYQCSNGYRTSQNCAEGTVFNPALSVCDWPQNVPECSGDETTEAPETEAPATQKPFDDDCEDESGNPVSGKPFEVPGECERFYQCSNGYRTSQNCAEGTVFNPALSVCDKPQNVPGCGGDETTEIQTTEAPKTEAPVTQKHFDDDCVDENGNPVSGKPFEVPGECGRFYQCSNGYRTSQNCAEGTVFNAALSVCDWPENVPECGGDGQENEAPTNQPQNDAQCIDGEGHPLSTIPFEKPDDCFNFYQCGAGILYTMPCAPGTVFNPKISVCDWNYHVPGC